MEEFNGEDFAAKKLLKRYFWGAQNRWELIARQRDTDGNETLDEELFVLSDAMDPAAIVNKNYCEKQDENLHKIQENCEGSRVEFTFEYDSSSNFHARSIITDTGWKITLDRGLDIFQKFDLSSLSLVDLSQEDRLQKGCEINYIREE